eukprot:3940672-Rhodomonas_salina.1
MFAVLTWVVECWVLLLYAAVRCAVLRQGKVPRNRYVVCGTESGYGAMHCACGTEMVYVLCGTEMVYAAMRSACGTELVYAAMRSAVLRWCMLLCAVPATVIGTLTGSMFLLLSLAITYFAIK